MGDVCPSTIHYHYDYLQVLLLSPLRLRRNRRQCGISQPGTSLGWSVAESAISVALRKLKTVLGRAQDLAPYKGRPGYNVLEMPRIRRIAGSFDDIATQATRNAGSNKVVLGKFSKEGRSYTNVAAHYKASYLKVENWNQVTKGMTQAEKWEINEAFLRQQLSAGKQVILSHNPATATGFFAKEVTAYRGLSL